VIRNLYIAGALTAFVLVLSLPGTAEACAVCFQAKSDAARVAFIFSTAAMTFLPLLVIGGVAWWVRRQFVRAELDAAAHSEAQLP
jgi:hypothetical protein